MLCAREVVVLYVVKLVEEAMRRVTLVGRFS